MTSIYDLSWSKTSFLSKLELFLKSRRRENQKIQSGDPMLRAEGLSALSSTYYSILGSAFSQLKATIKPKWLVWFAPVRILVWGFTWLPLATWCYFRMLTLSNRMIMAVGYENISADQCDIRQSILRRRNRLAEAKECIAVALGKNPEKAHTRGLLHAGLAEIYKTEGNWRDAELEVGLAVKEAEEAEKQDPRQAARIYRHCASIVDFFEMGDPIPGSQLRRKAENLSQAIGATDQLLKL